MEADAAERRRGLERLEASREAASGERGDVPEAHTEALVKREKE